jgi:DNA (cytosine-5)-methyltransferase 1
LLVPDHDILVGGFPCQPFSLAGVSKKNSLGKPHGFLDETQGTLFHDILAILEVRRPPAILLENVKNLVHHDSGNTFRIIVERLLRAGYQDLHVAIVDSYGFVPQHRERVFIAGFRKPCGFSWADMRFNGPVSVSIGDILHRSGELDMDNGRFTDARGNALSQFTLGVRTWRCLRGHKKRHRAQGSGFGYGLVSPQDTARTLSARYHKDGAEILVAQKGGRPRKLTPRECSRLMGFDRGSRVFRIPSEVSNTQAWHQFGNAVVVQVIEEVARLMVPCVERIKEREARGSLLFRTA